MEDNKICVVTEASDLSYQFNRTSIYSFVAANPWFDGTIYLLTNNEVPLSFETYKQLTCLYSKIKIIDTSSDDSFKELISLIKLKTNDHKEIILNYLKFYLFNLESQGILYFSRYSLFLNSIAEFIKPDTFSISIFSKSFPSIDTNSSSLNSSIFYVSKNNLSSSHYLNTIELSKQHSVFSPKSDFEIINLYFHNFENVKIYPNTLVSDYSNFIDRKYLQLSKYLNTVKSISYGNLNDGTNFLKIRNIWLHYNKQATLHLSKPSISTNGATSLSYANLNSGESLKNKNIPRKINNLVYSKPINDTKVSVLISAFGCVDFIEDCIDSIDNQTKSAHRILIGIDACEYTLEKIKSISHKYHNLEVFYSDINTGPYKVMNSLIQKIPDNEFFITFGADDKMHRNLIETMSINKSAKISRHDGVLYVQKSQFDKIGGYRPWRCAADTDMLFRLRKKLGAVHRIEILYDRGIHDNQLTKSDSLSNLRKSYIKIIQENEKSKNPTILIQPEFNKLTKIDIRKKLISVNMATYPARQYSFKPCMEKMLKYESIDKFRIYLNEFTEIPADFPKDPKIEYVIGLPNIKDTGKFHWAYENKNEYYFTVDDDIFYPESFFTEHIDTLKKYNGEILVTIHGKRVPPTPKNFHDTLKPAYHCLKHCPDDVWVHIGGTGVMVFDNSKFKLPKDLIKSHGMCDLWMATYAQQLNMPILCRKHLVGHISAIDIENKDTLFEKRHEMWNDQIKVLQSVTWKLNTK